MNVCVLIPAHNEAKQIGRLVKEVRSRGLVVVVIDDGSVDGTAAIAKTQGAEVIQNDPRRGKGFSLKRGFGYAMEKGFDGVIAMDGDGQHDPEDLEQILAAAQATPRSVVNGTRMRDTKDMPLVRRVTNRFMSWMISRIGGQKIEDTQCGYRYVSGDILKEITLTANDFEIETEILLKSCKAGYPIISVPIKTIYRDEKSNIRPIKDTIRFFAYLWRELRAKKNSA